MQKKLILATAIAGLMAAPAMADSNVTLYGLFDVGFKSNTAKTYNAAGKQTAKTTTRQFFGNEGLKNGNRLGVKGSEDLGNGVSAIFLYELALNPSTKNAGAGPNLSNRQAYVGLKGGFGTVTFGRQYTVQYDVIDGYDLSGDYGMLGSVDELVGARHHTTRLSNAVKYVSPSFSGFTVSLMGAKSSSNKENTGVPALGTTEIDDNQEYQLGLGYSAGGFDAGVAYTDREAVTLEAQVTPFRSVGARGVSLGTSYDFTVAKLAAVYNTYKNDTADIAGAKSVDNRLSDWMIAASAPVGPLSLGAQYSSGKTKNALLTNVDSTVAKLKGYALTAGYKMSKRTGLVFGYANGKVNRLANNANPGATKESSYGFSLQHRF